MRIPRAKGLTLLAINLQENPQPTKAKDKLITHLVRDYINNNFSVAQRYVSIEELASLYQVDVVKVYRKINQHASAMTGILSNREGLVDTVQMIAAKTISMAMEDRARVIQQTELLIRAQGDGYKAFISGEVGKMLKTNIDATKNMMDLFSKLQGGGGSTTNILIQGPDDTQDVKVEEFSTDDAIELLNERKVNNLKDDPKQIEALYNQYELDGADEVSVHAKESLNYDTMSIKKNENVALFKDGIDAAEIVAENEHENHRVKEMNIDEENDLDIA